VIPAVLDFDGGACFDRGCAAEFAAYNYQRVAEQSAAFGSLNEHRNRLVGLSCQFPVDPDVIVIIPGLRISEVDLHDAHAVLDEATRHQTTDGEITLAIKSAGGIAFLANPGSSVTWRFPQF
jgi:hypothetical protein